MHRTWDDPSVLYMPKRRRDVIGGWGVWDKRARLFLNRGALDFQEAEAQAEQANRTAKETE